MWNHAEIIYLLYTTHKLWWVIPYCNSGTSFLWWPLSFYECPCCTFSLSYFHWLCCSRCKFISSKFIFLNKGGRDHGKKKTLNQQNNKGRKQRRCWSLNSVWQTDNNSTWKKSASNLRNNWLQKMIKDKGQPWQICQTTLFFYIFHFLTFHHFAVKLFSGTSCSSVQAWPS